MKIISSYFVLQIDRDFTTNEYVTGLRLVIDKVDDFIIYDDIKGISFENDKLIVSTKNNEMFELINEPHNDLFKKTIYKGWKDWDSKYGKYQDEARVDFEPWSLNSKKAIAKSLNLINEKDILLYFEKSYK